ncbi:MAG: hypothetical protein AMXMBFR46_25780 [Acidimicrobiia bacterium]
MREGQDEGPPTGFDRRALIKRATVVGALAWTAPAIVDSVMSPAGALTLQGCYRFTIDATNSGCANATILNVSPLGCLPTPSTAVCPSVTTVTSGSINTYCLTVTAGDGGNDDDCLPEWLQADDTIVFGIDTGLSACECPSPTIEAAAGQFLLVATPTCYASGSAAVTISADKKSVTFGNPGWGNWQRYSFVVKCT